MNKILIEKHTKLKSVGTKINTSAWKEGIYLIGTKYKDEILSGKLVVKQ